jgi:processive 1,2-diacylglycerol beta-glucosyltransferase
MLNRVLILSASAGAGHLRAAQAIEKAFLQLNAAEQIKNIDVLEYTNPLFHKLYSKAYIEMVNKTPGLFGWFYEYFDKPWYQERRQLIFDKLNTKPFVKIIEQVQPDIAVCTHFLPAEILSWLKGQKRIRTRQVIVVTDFDLHAFWLCHHVEHYFVALDETRAHLEQLRVPSDKITVSGIPIDPVFAEKKDKQDMRRRLGLDAADPVILVSAGGFGIGPIEQLVQSLTAMRKKAQILVICGKNEELKEKVDARIRDLPASCPVRFVTLGYTTEIDLYMSAADLILGKTGGLTTSEALAKGLGFVIVNPIPGQEQRNADHLLEEGVAIKCNNWPVLAFKIDRLLADPVHLARMQQNAQRLAKPEAALRIVETIRDLETVHERTS